MRHMPIPMAAIGLLCVLLLATACPTTPHNGNTSNAATNTNRVPANNAADNGVAALPDRKPRELSVRCFGIDTLEQGSFTEAIPLGYIDVSVAAGGQDQATVEWTALEAAALYLYAGALADGETDKLRALDEWEQTVRTHAAWAEEPEWTDADRTEYLSGIEVNCQVRVAYSAFGQWLDTLAWIQMRTGAPLDAVPTPTIGLLAMDTDGAILTGLNDQQATAQQHLIDAIAERGAEAVGMSEMVGELAESLEASSGDVQAELLMTLLPADILLVYYVGRWENPVSYEVELSAELAAMAGQQVATALLEVFVGESDEVETEQDAMRVGCHDAIDQVWDRVMASWTTSCERGRLYRVLVSGNSWDLCDAYDMLCEMCNVVQVAGVGGGMIDMIVWAGDDLSTSADLLAAIQARSERTVQEVRSAHGALIVRFTF